MTYSLSTTMRASGGICSCSSEKLRAEIRSTSATNRIGRRDPAAERLLEEADLVDHLEEFVEGVKAEIEHLGDAVIVDQAVHQLHLAVGVETSAVSVTRGRYSSSDGSFRLMSKPATVPFFSSRNSAQQPREQRLADERTGRADDVDGRGVHRRLYQRNLSANPAPSRRGCDYFSPPRVVDLAPTRSVSLMRSNSLQTLASQCRT